MSVEEKQVGRPPGRPSPSRIDMPILRSRLTCSFPCQRAFERLVLGDNPEVVNLELSHASQQTTRRKRESLGLNSQPSLTAPAAEGAKGGCCLLM